MIKFKEDLVKFYDKLVKDSAGSDGSNFPSSFIDDANYINSEIMQFTPTEVKKSTDIAFDKNYSSLNLTECAETVRKYNNIPSNITLIYKKTDFSKEYNKIIQNNTNRLDNGVNIIY